MSAYEIPPKLDLFKLRIALGTFLDAAEGALIWSGIPEVRTAEDRVQLWNQMEGVYQYTRELIEAAGMQAALPWLIRLLRNLDKARILTAPLIDQRILPRPGRRSKTALRGALRTLSNQAIDLQNLQNLRASVVNDKPDGPEPPHWLRWKTDRLQIGSAKSRLPWQLLNYFWARDSASYEELQGPGKPWPDPVSESAIATAVNRFNNAMPNDFPWRLATKQYHVHKIPR
ncbi:MAG TPA: hypothetical protein VK395_23630 [Gemmataceae bacterium]|nr:hypothetical protein [Gemmataceae bacterium]